VQEDPGQLLPQPVGVHQEEDVQTHLRVVGADRGSQPRQQHHRGTAAAHQQAREQPQLPGHRRDHYQARRGQN